MPYAHELTWHDARSCWKKYRQGRTYYLAKGLCRGKSDRDGYETALSQWREIERRLKSSQSSNGSPRDTSRIDLSHTVRFASDYRHIHFDSIATSSEAIAETSISGLAKYFVQEHRQRAERGEICLKMYDEYRAKIEDFVSFAQGQGWSEVADINANLLHAYRQAQLQLVGHTDKHKISPHTAKRRLDKARLFVRWLYEQEKIAQWPRILTDRYARVEFTKPKPQFFTLDEVRRLFNAASRSTKLYIALALNCGYTQIDIATLSRECVDTKAGVIKRLRHKTGTPQVHKLWRVTRQLLLERMTPERTTLAVLDDNGKSLYKERIRGDGKLSQTDVIRLAFNRLMEKLGMAEDRRRFKVLKKTVANEIARRFPEYFHLSSQYLAHVEGSVRKHYVATHYDQLFIALDELEKYFDLRL